MNLPAKVLKPLMALWVEKKFYAGVPYGIRTRVAAVKGRCPRPLDEGDQVTSSLLVVSFKSKKEN
jgi:hypothetical protein